MSDVEPLARPLPLPAGYGTATRPLAWDEVERLLVDASTYWLATIRPDGRPHVVPTDGIWLDAALFFGGSPETIHMRNVRANPNAVVHVGDGLEAAVIVEGLVRDDTPDRGLAERLAETNDVKYAHYGMRTKADTYVRRGVTILRPVRVLAWTRFPENATRFTFEGV